MDVRQSKKKREAQRLRDLADNIERLEHELGIDDDGLVDLSTDPPKPPPSEPPPLLRLLWKTDPKTGALLPEPKLESLRSMPLYSSAYMPPMSATAAWPVTDHDDIRVVDTTNYVQIIKDPYK